MAGGMITLGTKVTVTTKSKVFSNINGMVFDVKQVSRVPERVVEGITEFAFDSTMQVLKKNVSAAVEYLGRYAAALIRSKLLPWDIVNYEPNRAEKSLRLANSVRTNVYIVTGTLSKAIENQSPKTVRVSSQAHSRGGSKYIRVSVQVGLNPSMVRAEQESLEELYDPFPKGTTPDYGAGLFMFLCEQAHVEAEIADWFHKFVRGAMRRGKLYASKLMNSESTTLNEIQGKLRGLNSQNTKAIREAATNRKLFMASMASRRSRASKEDREPVKLRDHKAERNSRKTPAGQSRRDAFMKRNANRKRNYGKGHRKR